LSYAAFIESKKLRTAKRGFDATDINPNLFRYQRDVVEWGCRLGTPAHFLDTGLGKTAVQLEFLHQCIRQNGKPALMVTPLAVAAQAKREADKFGYDARVIRHGDEVGAGINIINYHRLESVDMRAFGAGSLDESSILKSFSGKVKNQLVDSFECLPWRCANTATPAPNDYMEMGNHSEFLGVMPSSEMLARFFINDTMNMGKYRVKGHAMEAFWQWVASWAVCAQSPADLGHPEEVFTLPPLHQEIVPLDALHNPEESGTIVPESSLSALHLNRVKRTTLTERVDKTRELVYSFGGSSPVIVWCKTNAESSALASALPGFVEVVGSEHPDVKESKLLEFGAGGFKGIITKPSIAGFGLNWQHCNRMIFASVDYSYEQLYQAIRRIWRYGQTEECRVYILAAAEEQPVIESLLRKRDDHDKMKAFMRGANFSSGTAKAHETKRAYDGAQSVIIPTWIKDRLHAPTTTGEITP
jgi:hypothetical protein